MEHHKLIRSAGLVGGLTSISRLLGLIRDFLTAGFFGTSLAMSAFVVAFRIPNLFRALFGEGALSSAFVPVFIQVRHHEGEAEAWRLARKIFSLGLLVLLGVVLAGVAGISVYLAAGSYGPKTAMILPLVRIMLPYMLFICLAALSMGVLNSYHRFSLPALTPSLLNLTWIAFLLGVCPLLGHTPAERIYGVAWGVFTAGVIQLAFQYPALKRVGFRFGFTWSFNDPRVWRVFALMGPAALGLAVIQVNVMINSLLAVWIGVWAPAALFYAERLIYFPQGLLATALSTVLLPVLSSHAARADFARIRETVNHSLRVLLFIMTPAALGLFALATPIVEALFQWRHFTAESTWLTSRALMFYAPGLLVFCLAKVFVPTFYALQNTRTPVKTGLFSVALNFTLNLVFIFTLPTYWKHAGLALATVISEGVNGLLLAFLLRRRVGSYGWRSIGLSLARFLVAAGAMAAVLWFFCPWLKGTLLDAGWLPKLAQIASVAVSLALGMVIYFGAAYGLRCPEIHEVIAAIRNRAARKRPAPGVADSEL